MRYLSIYDEKNFVNTGVEQGAKELRDLYESFDAPNRSDIGYFDGSLTDYGVNEFGIAEFTSEVPAYGGVKFSTKTTAAVLGDSILMKQSQVGKGTEDYQIYSWDKDASNYTCIFFKSEEAMDLVYQELSVSPVSRITRANAMDMLSSFSPDILNEVKGVNDIEIEWVKKQGTSK